MLSPSVANRLCFYHDFALPHDLLKLCGVAQNFPNDIDGTGWHDLARLAHRRLAKENTQGLARGPVAQVTEFDNILRALIQLGVDRDGEVDLIAPGVERSTQGQCRSNALGGRGLVQLCLYGKRTDSYSNTHNWPPFLVSDCSLLQHPRMF